MELLDTADFESFSSLFRGKWGHRFAAWVMRFLAIDKVNRAYEYASPNTGNGFTSRLLDYMGINYAVGNAERLNELPEGAFITISNHPYGGLDGIISIDLLGGFRPDYRFMVNELLYMIKPLRENFIPVTPTGNKKSAATATSIKGIKETMEHLHNGHPAGFFPSGAVSDFSLRDLCVRDRKWQESILRLIHAVKVPILPLRFFDKNSPFFYFLGLIYWKIRLLRLPSEFINKKDREPRIGIGKIISVEEQSQFADPDSFGVFLRKKVYGMPLPSLFTPRKKLKLREYRTGSYKGGSYA